MRGMKGGVVGVVGLVVEGEPREDVDSDGGSEGSCWRC